MPIYCYRVESYPFDPNNMNAPVCAFLPQTGEQTIIQTVCGTSVDDVCQQMKDMDLFIDIQSMAKWSNTLYGPYGGGESPSRDMYGCFTDIPDFCKYTNCVDFCVTIKGNVNFTAISFATTDANIIQTGGGFELIGSSQAFASKYEYAVSGIGFELNGTSPASQTGGIDGTAYIGSGGFALTGSASYKGSDIGIYVQDFGMDMTAVNLAAVLVGTSGPTLTGFGGVARSNICDCENVPYRLSLRHNLNKSSELTRFLARNNLSIPTVVTMVYSEFLGYYTCNLKFSGISSFVNNSEDWYLSFNLYCTGELNKFANRYNWLFTLNIRRSTVGFASYETNVITYLLSSFICPQFNASSINFKTSLNISTSLLTVNKTVFVNSSNVNDGIKLFYSSAWLSDPNLIFSFGVPS